MKTRKNKAVMVSLSTIIRDIFFGMAQACRSCRNCFRRRLRVRSVSLKSQRLSEQVQHNNNQKACVTCSGRLRCRCSRLRCRCVR